MTAFSPHWKRRSGIRLQILTTFGLLLTASHARAASDTCSPDDTPPVVTCQEYGGTAECGGYASGNPGLQYSDNCRIDSVTTDYARAYAVGDTLYTTARVSDGRNTSTCQTRWTVTDTRPPSISLAGEAEMTVRQGRRYVDPGAAYVDDSCEGWRGQGPYESTNTVNPDVAGTYTVTYRSTDRSGNTGTAVRTVHVVADTATVSAVGKSLQIHVRHTTTPLEYYYSRLLVLGGYSRAAEEFDPNNRTWAATGLPVAAHRGHTATWLSNGTVLVAGGAKSGTSSVEELYNPQTRQFVATGKMSTVRYDHVAVQLSDGRVLVAGGGTGESSGGALASAEIYNPSTQTWTATGSMSIARRSPTLTVLNDQILVTGGIGADGTPQSAAELYNPSTGTWTSVGSLSTGRTGHTATVLRSGAVLLVGGQTKNAALGATTEVFDPSTRAWYARRSLNTARRDHTAVLLKGRLVVLGGYNAQAGVLASTEIYDESNDTWTPNTPLSVARYKHTTSLVFGTTAVVVSGTSNQDSTQTETFALPPYSNE